MAAGWAANAAVYLAPPVPPADLQIRMGAFIIQRRLRASGLWSNAEMTIESEITLTNPGHGKEWEYRARPPKPRRRQALVANKGSEGQPRNTITAVL
jgi:hypothetical protein